MSHSNHICLLCKGFVSQAIKRKKEKSELNSTRTLLRARISIRVSHPSIPRGSTLDFPSCMEGPTLPRGREEIVDLGIHFLTGRPTAYGKSRSKDGISGPQLSLSCPSLIPNTMCAAQVVGEWGRHGNAVPLDWIHQVWSDHHCPMGRQDPMFASPPP